MSQGEVEYLSHLLEGGGGEVDWECDMKNAISLLREFGMEGCKGTGDRYHSADMSSLGEPLLGAAGG